MKFDYALNWDRKCRYRPRKECFDLMGVDDKDHIIQRISHTKTFYEIALLNHLLVRAPLGGVYVDIGANIGNHAVFFAKFLADHVVCVEPSAKIRPVLKRNLDVNGIVDYSLVDCALGATEALGRVQYPDNNNIGMTKIIADTRADDASVEYVNIRTLDAVIDELHLLSRPVSLMKIDVEGMESEVLQGAKNILTTDQPQLVLEAATEKEQKRLFAQLKPFGYEPIARFCVTPTFHMIIPSIHKLRKVTLFYRGVRLFRRIQRIMA